MINSIKVTTVVFILALASINSFAATDTKVVVIPMAADAPTGQWALVKGDGTIISQSGGITAIVDDIGVYIINFGKAVTGHAIIATRQIVYGTVNQLGAATVAICGADTSGITGELARCNPPRNNTSHVAVGVSDSSGTLTNGSFYIVVLP